MEVSILIILTSVMKSLQLDTSCGTELYSAYHSELNTTCYDIQEIDDLPLVDLEGMPEDSIFFIEASCKGGLNLREACSVEAAAHTNPSRQVHVLFAGPVPEHCLKSEPLASLLTYKNIRLNRIYVEEFANGTGLGHLLKNVEIDSHPYPVLYALDLLKFVTLHKFDGIYMALDMLATRPFDELPRKDDWVGIGDHTHGMLSSSIFAASSHVLGRKFIQTLLSELKHEPVSEATTAHVMKAAVESVCGVVPFNKTGKQYSFTCRGLVLYSSNFFFPVPCETSKEYFGSQLDMKILTRSFTQQLCNGLTFEEIITEPSVYAQLMKRYCPKVYKTLSSVGFNENIREHRHEDGNFNEITADSERRSGLEAAPTNRSSKRKWYYDINVTAKNTHHSTSVVTVDPE